MYAAHVLCIFPVSSCIYTILYPGLFHVSMQFYASVPGLVYMHLCEQLDRLPAFKLLLLNKCQMNMYPSI